MCGIAGFVNNHSDSADRSVLEAMNRAIVHRGPDDQGFYVHENVGLGMCRLSIIDVAGGHQPIHNADKTKWIVFNGEIYNYQEIRTDLTKRGHRFYTNSDTESILHLYDDFGEDCVNYLRGMFAFAIWDSIDRSLFLARDRVGKKPLLYSYQPNGNLIFGSEFQALLKHPDVSRDVDSHAIDEYLSYAYVPAPRTAFRSIRKLEPGHWLKWKSGRIETKRYWLPDFSRKIKISEEDAIDETTRLLRESTKLRMISEVPLGAFLSGGVDSSTIVALMAQESDRPVKTFSIGFEEQDFSELKYAKRVAEHVGAEHHEFIVKPNTMDILPLLVRHYGEPYGDSSALPTYIVARETRKHVTVALNGDGGDESFAGYERYLAMKMASRYNGIPQIFRERFLEPAVEWVPTSEIRRSRFRDLKRFVRSAGLSQTDRYRNWTTSINESLKTSLLKANHPPTHNSDGGHNAWFELAKSLGPVDTAMFVDQMTYLPNDLLVKVDIASMAASLEARSPFLDHKVIEFAASLPEALKLQGATTKALLKKVAGRLVPPDVIRRRKMGFGVPYNSWFRNELKDFLRQVLLSERSFKRGVFEPKVLKMLVDEHVNAQQDRSQQLYTILMLELWFQTFIDK